VGGDVGAVAHDGDAVAEAEDLVEAVGDEEDAAAGVPQAAGDGEQPLHLDTAECRRGLVHDQHAGVEGDGLGDLDDLLVGDGESLRHAVRIDRDAELVEQLLGAPAHLDAADQAEPALRLASDEDVLGHREVGEQRGLLVDDRDARGLAVGHVAEADGLSRDDELAGVGLVHPCEDLHERGLARAVLSHQRVDLTGREVDGAVREGDDRAERLQRPPEGQHGGPLRVRLVGGLTATCKVRHCGSSG
jgi:hypothetical protein